MALRIKFSSDYSMQYAFKLYDRKDCDIVFVNKTGAKISYVEHDIAIDSCPSLESF